MILIYKVYKFSAANIHFFLHKEEDKAIFFCIFHLSFFWAKLIPGLRPVHPRDEGALAMG